MGDPRKLKRTYSRPRILWDKERIQEERALLKEYGLKNMRELWRAASQLRAIRRQARQFLALGEEGTVAAQPVLQRLRRYGMVGEQATLEDVLGLTVRDILERRLQTQVYKKGLARTIKQARQLIVHGFIAVDGRTVSRPGYLVTADEEDKLSYTRPIDINAGLVKKQSEDRAAETVEESRTQSAEEERPEQVSAPTEEASKAS